jgi:hypothetical protein
LISEVLIVGGDGPKAEIIIEVANPAISIGSHIAAKKAGLDSHRIPHSDAVIVDALNDASVSLGHFWLTERPYTDGDADSGRFTAAHGFRFRHPTPSMSYPLMCLMPLFRGVCIAYRRLESKYE